MKFLKMKNLFLIISLSIVTLSAFAWEVDFSRRAKYLKKGEVEMPLSTSISTPAPTQSAEPLSTARILNTHSPANEIVILNTENGFIPKSLPLRKGVRYRINVVNINEKEKNVSFIMGSFQQHHGTYYGQMKTFEIVPQSEGVYTYQCPETSWEGKVVVLPVSEERELASEE